MKFWRLYPLSLLVPAVGLWGYARFGYPDSDFFPVPMDYALSPNGDDGWILLNFGRWIGWLAGSAALFLGAPLAAALGRKPGVLLEGMSALGSGVLAAGMAALCFRVLFFMIDLGDSVGLQSRLMEKGWWTPLMGAWRWVGLAFGLGWAVLIGRRQELRISLMRTLGLVSAAFFLMALGLSWTWRPYPTYLDVVGLPAALTIGLLSYAPAYMARLRGQT